MRTMEMEKGKTRRRIWLTGLLVLGILFGVLCMKPDHVQAATTYKSGKTTYTLKVINEKVYLYGKTGTGKTKYLTKISNRGYSPRFLFKYSDKLYFTFWGEDCPHIGYYDLSKKKERIASSQGAVGIQCAYKRYGRYLPYMSYFRNLCVLDLKTGKEKIIQKNCRYAMVSNNILYYVKVCKSYSYPTADVVVARCTMTGTSKKNLSCVFRIYGPVTKLTTKTITYRGKSGSCTRTYVKKVTPKISFSSSGSTGGSSCKLSVKTTPGSQKITWSSSNTGIATVSGGTVTAKRSGTVTITASMKYGGKMYSVRKKIVIGYRKSYGSWSAWSLNPASSSSSLEVQTTALYRYYYFYCPVCGGREPYQGLSDCHRYSLKLSDGHAGWFPTPYSQCNSQPYSYTTAKRYTTSLGGGQIWNFTAAEINCNTIGYYSYEALDTIIRRGYRTRSVYTSYYIKSIN